MYTTWEDLPTMQSKEIITELMQAKEEQKALLLISNTGLGKSNTVKLFLQTMPKNTFCVTVGGSYKLHDVINAILDELGVDYSHFKGHAIHTKLKLIASRLKDLQAIDGLPMIILDEAENLLPAVLKMLKELYDAIHKYCSIVLIGTDQILDNMLNRRNKNRQSVPQLWRRFEAGVRYISPLNKTRDFKPFFERYLPDNEDIQLLLTQLCHNYGVLHDRLHPVLLKAAKQNKPVTLKLFKLVNGIND